MSTKTRSGRRRVVTPQSKAVSKIFKVAAELVLDADLPNPELEEFRPMGKQAIRKLHKSNLRRAKELERAINLLRTGKYWQ